MNSQKYKVKLQENSQKFKKKFALTTDTINLTKGYSEESLTAFNPKTYIKKAYKAYLKGLMFFSYKGESYPVPRVTPEYLSKLSEELEREEQLVPILEDQEVNKKIKEQW